VARLDREGRSHTLMVLQAFVFSQGDAWGWTHEFLQRVVDDLAVSQQAGSEFPFEGYDAFAKVLGRRLAEMHRALAQPTEDPAFALETTSEADAAALAEMTRAQLEAAWRCLDGEAARSTPELAELVQRLAPRRRAAMALADRLAAGSVGTPRTRIHGDLHLGQVLVTGADAVIIDFEGEPARSLEARRAKSSPLRDVAGLIRSFDYAAATAERSATVDPTVLKPLGSLLERFRRGAIRAFLDGYVEGGGTLIGPLLDLFLLQKAAYEVCYEAASRPDWLGVPLRGLADLIGRLATEAGDAAP
jgi:maltose alpha-D-glucosyltransferase/alpha-amylase